MARRNSRKDKIPAGKPVATSPEAGSGRLWLWFAAALVIACIVYGPAMNGARVFDDNHLPFSDPQAPKAGAGFWLGGVRPVLMATYWANFLMSGTAVLTFHLTNLLLHLLNTALLFFVLRRLFDCALLRLDRRWCALFGAGLFLLHPLQTESVAYIAGRSEEVGCLFIFWAWLIFLKSFRAEISLWTSGKVLFLFAAAVLSKESAITLPAILFLTDLYWNPVSLRSRIQKAAKLYLPIAFGAVIAVAGILQTLTTATAAGFAIEGVTPGIYALTQCRVILTYIRLFLLPFGQNGDWGLPFDRSLGGGAWICVLGIGALVAGIAWTYRRARLLSFGMLTFLVILLPTSSIVPIKDALAERRMYVPIVGLIVASIWALGKIRPGAQMLRIVTIGILAIAGGLTFERSAVWSSDVLFWQDSTEKNPANGRAHNGLGVAYLSRGRCEEAVKEFKIVERQNGITDETRANLASAYQCNHQLELALQNLQMVIRTHPTANLYGQLGYLEGALGHTAEAMSALNEAISRDPQNALAYAYRGVLRIGLDDRVNAAADLQRSLEIEPGNKAAVSGMTMLLGRN